MAAERPSLTRGGLVLAPSVALTHGLHYAYNVVMAAVLGPAAFGALGALLALILLGSVPGIALQAMAARHTALLATDQRDQRALWASLLRLAAWWGAGLAAAVRRAAQLALRTRHVALGDLAGVVVGHERAGDALQAFSSMHTQGKLGITIG